MRATLVAAAAAVAWAGFKPRHVVLLQMENRAMDHMLGGLAKFNGSAIRGLTGNETNPVDPQDPSSPTVQVSFDAAYVDSDPGHEVSDTAQQIYGRTWNISTDTPPTMNGFVANARNNTGAWYPNIMRSFHPASVPVISTLALEYAVIDAFHAAVPGCTFPNRLYTQSATTHGFGTNNVGETLTGWPQKSILGALTDANVTWRVYFSEAATSWLFQDQRNDASFANNRLIEQFAADVAAGDLPQFTVLDPAFFSISGVLNGTDQHPDHPVDAGERLMAQVYEALRSSPVWNDTVLLITYDEHGGFYDAVPPPFRGVPNPDGLPCSDCAIPFDFDRLGVRIPMVVVSPWVERGRVIHAPPPAVQPQPTSQFELSSIPATLHRIFATAGFLTARDAWAAPLNWIWENSTVTAPRADCPTILPTPPYHAATAHISQGKQPLTHLQQDLLYLALGALGGVHDRAAADALIAARGVTTEEQASLWMRQMAVANMPALSAAARAPGSVLDRAAAAGLM